MARPKDTTMSDQFGNATEVVKEKKARKPQGPRTPSPLYAFATVTNADGSAVVGGKVTIAKSFRDPRKMAEYFTTAKANGEELLVINPES